MGLYAAQQEQRRQEAAAIADASGGIASLLGAGAGFVPPPAELEGAGGLIDEILYGVGNQDPLDPFGGGGGFAMGAIAGGGGGGGGGGSSFTARPPGRDFGGYDVTPNNLLFRQGLTGVPQAVRTLLAAERALGVPGLSDAVSGVGYRSSAQQAALYQDHLAGRHPAPVAPPGQSYHEQGEAFDISSSWLSANPRVRPWLERHGFTFDVPGEPWHAHYVGGGRPIAGVRDLTPATGNQGRRIPAQGRTPRRRSSPPRPTVVARPTRYRRR
ncbi:MAG TPA: M15 family metallopeptidase [Actinomycetota bacterium]|nr:M15 family metallopeptidase [Actinomycetota bacterium]